ncbi:MAG: DUF4906 domain-containing protein [Parabacteroides johnsonii]|nr:DUF4906 domain-containing protein [Parabacteroides johnsonii]
MRQFISILIISLLFISCNDETEIPAGNDVDDIKMRLVITIPPSTVYSATKAAIGQPIHESLVSEIQVLVFEDQKYRYRVPGISISSNTAQTTFTAHLKSTGSPVELLILANANEAVVSNEPSLDDSEDVVKRKINREFDNLVSNFPMYGVYKFPAGLSATQKQEITGIKMLRSIARVDVMATEVSNFKLAEVKAYRANNFLQVIPNEIGVMKVTIPSVPDGSAANVNSRMFPVAEEDLNEFSAQLYLPETSSPAESNRISGATCVVVGGYYNGSDKLSYYRMDFDPDNKDNSFGQILRNHKYIFNIKKVSAPGWDSPDDAANNQSAHIVAEVQQWDDNTIDMSFDGEHHFGVSTREIILKNKAGSKSAIDVATDLPDYTLQWADADGEPAGNESQSLADEYFTVEKNPDGSQLVVTALQNDTSDDAGPARNFVITAHRWKISVSIKQKYDEAASRVISLLTFNTGLGSLGSNIIASISPEGRAGGLRGILDNRNNFGPNGTVVCGGYNLIQSNVSNNKLTDALFAAFDVVYIHYMSNAYFGNKDAEKVHNWLKAKKNRVLIASYDAADVSKYLIAELLGGNSDIKFLVTNNGGFTIAPSDADNSYFISTGPFTSGAYTPISPDFVFRNFDYYHGEILLNTESAKGITPLLIGKAGGIVLGVDYSRRIVYIGDTDLGNYSLGTGGTDSNRINNTTGEISNDASKLMANVFAWITNTVLYGE